jgi:glycerol-3-phosphate dehydrogenase (NAD(P)+)
MANIVILWAGSMGTAFSFPCSDSGHSVSIIGTHLEDDFINQILSTRKHPTLDCEVQKNVTFSKFEKLKEEINKKVDLIVVAVVSKGIEWVSKELSKVLKNNVPILILTKGLAINNNNYEVLAHKMERLLKKNGVAGTNISAAGGPCLAKNLANKAHTSVVFANKDIKVVEKISKLVSTDYYHVSTSDDVVGLELCAAIKNIFSMAVGASQGLCDANKSKEKNYLNTAAALIQESIYEMITFVEKLKGKKETVIGLAGIGDLYVSADGGRNSKMGEYLGQGMTFQEAKKTKMPNITVEGADLALEIGSKIKSDFDNKTLPLMISMIDTICEEKPLKINRKNFK